ncbi:hypothetical protein JG687_00012830 [Phytophthora cactorum]|uniref:DDE-1 domain-containing protein n=1 Tax=Phytophthora cactorum TaxID=29920 RepID=A0A8T1U4D0_9STRA|nr:hypothetical protein JG687_00012830 [Phytophthora cactorum]
MGKSALGKKLPAFVVFSGVLSADLYTDMSDPNWGHPGVVHTTQPKAWYDHATMMKWIEEVWAPAVQGCRILMLDTLQVYKMESVKQHLEDTCTKVQYIPTGLSQPMDVRVMCSFKSNIQYVLVDGIAVSKLF